MRRFLRTTMCVLLVTAAPVTLHAQERIVDRKEFHLGFNMVLGGLYAAIGAAARDDGDPLAAFARGAAGGMVTWGGQRMIAGGEVTRLPGVQVAALGANITRNAANGVAVLSDVTLPVYPMYVRIRTGAPQPVTVRLSAAGLAGATWAFINTDAMQADIDWRASLLTGSPVFRSGVSHIYPGVTAPPPECYYGDGCAHAAAGVHWLGSTVYTTGGRTTTASNRILAHETVHLTQVHRDAILFAIPASDRLLAWLGGPFASARDVFVFDVFLPMAAVNQALASTLPRRGGQQWRFFEIEARAHGPK